LISYVFYKLKNYWALILYTQKIAPLLRVKKKAVSNSLKNVFFDFSDRTTHLGDRLFFVPLIKKLVSSGFSVSINGKDKVTLALVEGVLGVALEKYDAPSAHDVVIYPAPSYFNLRKEYPEAVIVDFTDCDVTSKISDQLINSLNKSFHLNLMKNDFRPFNAARIESKLLPSESLIGCYLFSNYIDSGRFRKFFIDENKLLIKARNLKKQGYKIIHVGSSQDLINDKVSYSFVDVDLRGQTSITDLIQMVQSENVVGAITYDNFLMHLVGMYGKIAYVLFRGRFTRKNREHHMLHVNNTFFDQKDKLIYL
jgi:hypothetical protein